MSEEPSPSTREHGCRSAGTGSSDIERRKYRSVARLSGHSGYPSSSVYVVKGTSDSLSAPWPLNSVTGACWRIAAQTSWARAVVIVSSHVHIYTLPSALIRIPLLYVVTTGHPCKWLTSDVGAIVMRFYHDGVLGVSLACLYAHASLV